MPRSLSALVSLASFGALTACGGPAPCPPGVALAPPPAWRALVTVPDHGRIRAWRSALLAALAEARAAGFGDAIAREGALFDPDAAIEPAALPPGTYSCRSFRLGAAEPGTLAFVAGPSERCGIAGAPGRQGFAKLGGVQRPVGTLFADTPERSVFLGVMVLAAERAPIRYGRDPDRDMAGIVQRIGDQRWRLILPHPAWGATAEVIELTPAR